MVTVNVHKRPPYKHVGAHPGLGSFMGHGMGPIHCISPTGVQVQYALHYLAAPCQDQAQAQPVACLLNFLASSGLSDAATTDTGHSPCHVTR